MSLYSYLTYLTPLEFSQIKEFSNYLVTIHYFTFKSVNVYYRKKKHENFQNLKKVTFAK